MYRGHFGACKKWIVRPWCVLFHHTTSLLLIQPGCSRAEGVSVITGCPQGESWLYFYFMLYSYEFVYNIFRDCSSSSKSIVVIPERELIVFLLHAIFIRVCLQHIQGLQQFVQEYSSYPWTNLSTLQGNITKISRIIFVFLVWHLKN